MLRQAFTGNLLCYVLLAFGVQLGRGRADLADHWHPAEFPSRSWAAVTTARCRSRGWSGRCWWRPGIACINIDLFAGGGGAHGAAADAVARPAWQKLAGVACAAGALVCWTLYAVDNARYLQRHPHYSGNEWSALYGLSTGLVSVVLAGIGWLVAGDG